MNTIYIGQSFEFSIECTLDGVLVNNADTAILRYQKPGETVMEGFLPAYVDNLTGILSCTIPKETNDTAGKWKFQPEITLEGDLTIPGTTVELVIKRRFT
jgi:hypothetical protein